MKKRKKLTKRKLRLIEKKLKIVKLNDLRERIKRVT